jgi:hypothetical protein
MSFAEDRTFTILRILKIITLAMCLGPLIFLGIIAYIFDQQGRGLVLPGDLAPVTLAALAFFAVGVPISFVLPGVVLRNAVSRIASGTWQPPQSDYGRVLPGPFTDTEKLMLSRQNAHIIGMALLEGPTMMALIALMLEGQVLALAAAGLGLLLILARFPTEGRIRPWLEEQTERLTQLRQDDSPR